MSADAPNPADRPFAYLKWEREQFADWYASEAARREVAEREASLRRAAEHARIARQAKRAKERREALKVWRAGVAKIMAEVRRREAERALPEAPFYSSDNPLDGERLWA